MLGLGLHAYIDGAGLASDPRALLFQSYSPSTRQLTGNPLSQPNAYAMIQRRALAAEITTKIGNTRFVRRALRRISRTAGRLRRPRRWRTMPAPARRNFTTAAPRRSRLTEWRGY